MKFEEWEKKHMGESLKGKTINEVAKAVHANAKAHGWWEGGERNFGELIALCHSELSEAFEEYRNGHEPTETYYSCHASIEQPLDSVQYKGCPTLPEKCNNGCAGHYGKMEGIPSELADVVIRVMDMCEHYGIDLEAAIAEKHAYNLTRPYRHGGKKA
mgnify:CR=1 FL=1